tara:strand:+ start:193 stop:360 length:168 start_codon:yes stop_codon:yes gene_type:complete
MKTIRDITHSYAEALDGERFPVWEKKEDPPIWQPVVDAIISNKKGKGKEKINAKT